MEGKPPTPQKTDEELAKGYDELYEKNDNVFYEGKPESFVRDILKYLDNGSVLEIGAGEGRNALFLAKNGFDVTVQDISKVGMEKVARKATNEDVEIKTLVGDARKLDWDKNYDALITSIMLHHLSREEALDLITKMQDHTKLHGLNIITTMTKESDFYAGKEDTDKFYLDPEELKKLYAGWEIIDYEEKEAEHGNEKGKPPKINTVAKIMARKI